MLPQMAASPELVNRFMREIENTKALSHPNIIQLFNYGYDQQTFFFTLEYCQGRSLQNLVRQQKQGKLAIDEAISITLQILDALDYAHQAEIPNVKLANGKLGKGKGLVHRDINPNNILLTTLEAPYTAKIADFGIAKAFDLAGFSGLSLTDSKIGSPQFMSRQQVLDCKYAKPEVDIWATAATLYYMLTGKYHRNMSGADLLNAILNNALIPIQTSNPAIPKPLADVVDLALQEQPELHFKTARNFKQALVSAC